MSWFGKSKQCASLFDAIAQSNAAEIARFLAQEEFTLVEEVSQEDGSKGAMIAEFDDFPVLVAFTSNDHAAEFAGGNPDLLAHDGSLPAFVVGGTDLLRYLPDGFGVVFNPESAEENVIPPDLVRQVKSA